MKEQLLKLKNQGFSQKNTNYFNFFQKKRIMEIK